MIYAFVLLFSFLPFSKACSPALVQGPYISSLSLLAESSNKLLVNIRDNNDAWCKEFNTFNGELSSKVSCSEETTSWVTFVYASTYVDNFTIVNINASTSLVSYLFINNGSSLVYYNFTVNYPIAVDHYVYWYSPSGNTVFILTSNNSETFDYVFHNAIILYQENKSIKIVSTNLTIDMYDSPIGRVYDSLSFAVVYGCGTGFFISYKDYDNLVMIEDELVFDPNNFHAFSHGVKTITYYSNTNPTSTNTSNPYPSETFILSNLSNSSGSLKTWQIAVIAVAAVLVAALLTFVGVFCYRRRNQKHQLEDSSTAYGVQA